MIPDKKLRTHFEVDPGPEVEGQGGSAAQVARALSARVQRWSLSLGAAPAHARTAASAALRLSLLQAQGHVCLVLDDPSEGRALLASGMARRSLPTTAPDEPQAGPQSGDTLRPFVIDPQQRLYFARSFDDELALARRLARAASLRMPVATMDMPRATQRLNELFAPGIDRQKAACALALLKALVIVSGGPGTGKTTTLARMLACLFAAQPGLRVALAAPTGKAATRMTAALARLPEVVTDAMLQQIDARTVHAWLGVHPLTGRARHDAARPLPVDLVVVDEASMLDLALARRFFDAVPAHARIVMLGDKDQLAAVESGAVFAELAQGSSLGGSSPDVAKEAPGARASGRVAHQVARLCGVDDAAFAAAFADAPRGRSVESNALADHVIWLTHSHRFGADSGIGRLARCVRDGHTEAALLLLHDLPAAGDVAWHRIEAADGAKAEPVLKQWMAAGFEPYAQAMAKVARADAGDRDLLDAATLEALQAFESFRVLAAVRAGRFGTQALNEHATGWLLARLQDLGCRVTQTGDGWHTGRPVMVTRNDPAHDLRNGDIGIVLAPSGKDPWRVAFMDGDATVKAWPLRRLSHLETAFAGTIHKSQGSEHDRVLIVLPSPWQRPCTRELLYTAITRARIHVALVADEDTLRQTVTSQTLRLGGLSERLKETMHTDLLGASS